MSRKGDPFNFDDIYSKIGAENMVKKPMAGAKKPVEHATFSTEGPFLNNWFQQTSDKHSFYLCLSLHRFWDKFRETYLKSCFNSNCEPG
jgi:hypothetical protein